MRLMVECPLCFETFGPIEDLSFPDQTITGEQPAWLGCLHCGAPYLIAIRNRPLSKDEWELIRRHEADLSTREHR